MKYKFVFDLDGTVTSQETLPLIGKHFGIHNELDYMTKAALEGKVPFQESFITRVALLSKLPVSEISSLLADVPLHPELAKFIREYSDDCHIATGNIRAWVERLLEKVGCSASCSEADVQDDRIVKLRKLLKKEKVVDNFRSQGFNVVFIGDGHNDMEAMRLADVAIAAGLTHYPASTVLEVADYAVFDEGTLCKLLRRLC